MSKTSSDTGRTRYLLGLCVLDGGSPNVPRGPYISYSDYCTVHVTPYWTRSWLHSLGPSEGSPP